VCVCVCVCVCVFEGADVCVFTIHVTKEILHGVFFDNTPWWLKCELS